MAPLCERQSQDSFFPRVADMIVSGLQSSENFSYLMLLYEVTGLTIWQRMALTDGNTRIGIKLGLAKIIEVTNFVVNNLT